MNCLKCGTAIDDGAFFCENCLKSMEKYPIPKNTVLVLPSKAQLAVRKAPRKRALSTEELLSQTRKQLRKVRCFAFIQFLVILLLIGGCVYFFMKDRKPALGQNYSTVSTAATSGSLPLEGK